MSRCVVWLVILALLACERRVAAVLELDVGGEESMRTRMLEVDIDVAGIGARSLAFGGSEAFTLWPPRQILVTFADDEIGLATVAVRARQAPGGQLLRGSTQVDVLRDRVVHAAVFLAAAAAPEGLDASGPIASRDAAREVDGASGGADAAGDAPPRAEDAGRRDGGGPDAARAPDGAIRDGPIDAVPDASGDAAGLRPDAAMPADSGAPGAAPCTGFGPVGVFSERGAGLGDLASDGQYLYWLVQYGTQLGAIQRMSRQGGSVETLAADEVMLNPSLLVGPAHVMWKSAIPGRNAWTIRSVPHSGGEVTTIGTWEDFGSAPFLWAIDADLVYWGGYFENPSSPPVGTQTYRASQAGGDEALLFTGLPFTAETFVSRGNSLFWGAQGNIYTASVGGTVGSFAAGDTPAAMLAAGGLLVWAARAPDGRSQSLRARPLDGTGETRTLLTAETPIGLAVVVGGAVVWNTHGIPNEVLCTSLSDGATTTLASGTLGFRSLTGDSTALYWFGDDFRTIYYISR